MDLIIQSTGERRKLPTGASYVYHPSFEKAKAAKELSTVCEEDYPKAKGHDSDELTRAFARAMHYCAWRWSKARRHKDQALWRDRYYAHRDRVVVGNHKLIYRAVNRWMPKSQWADDLLGTCQIVFIQTVAAYNPWIGVRFSTYAFTCLMRALSRQSRRQAADKLATSMSLDVFPEGEPTEIVPEESPDVKLKRIYKFLRDNHSLLSSREKKVLMRRFSLDGRSKAGTLSQVGEEMGLSKERVRQLQLTAIGKIREAVKEEV